MATNVLAKLPMDLLLTLDRKKGHPRDFDREEKEVRFFS